MSEQCDGSMEDVPMEGTVTYDIPLRLVLNLDGEGMGRFRELCAHHRQAEVDNFMDHILLLVNAAGGSTGALIRADDIDTEVKRLSTT